MKALSLSVALERDHLISVIFHNTGDVPLVLRELYPPVDCAFVGEVTGAIAEVDVQSSLGERVQCFNLDVSDRRSFGINIQDYVFFSNEPHYFSINYDSLRATHVKWLPDRKISAISASSNSLLVAPPLERVTTRPSVWVKPSSRSWWKFWLP